MQWARCPPPCNTWTYLSSLPFWPPLTYVPYLEWWHPILDLILTQRFHIVLILHLSPNRPGHARSVLTLIDHGQSPHSPFPILNVLVSISFKTPLIFEIIIVVVGL